MIKYLFIAIFTLFLIPRFLIKEEREPSNLDPRILNKMLEACSKLSEDSLNYNTVCKSYRNSKEKIETELKRYGDDIADVITPEASAISLFLLKSIYDQEVKFEASTPIGDPSVSFSNTDTRVYWKIEKKF